MITEQDLTQLGFSKINELDDSWEKSCDEGKITLKKNGDGYIPYLKPNKFIPPIDCKYKDVAIYGCPCKFLVDIDSFISFLKEPFSNFFQHLNYTCSHKCYYD